MHKLANAVNWISLMTVALTVLACKPASQGSQILATQMRGSSQCAAAQLKVDSLVQELESLRDVPSANVSIASAKTCMAFGGRSQRGGGCLCPSGKVEFTDFNIRNFCQRGAEASRRGSEQELRDACNLAPGGIMISELVSANARSGSRTPSSTRSTVPVCKCGGGREYTAEDVDYYCSDRLTSAARQSACESNNLGFMDKGRCYCRIGYLNDAGVCEESDGDRFGPVDLSADGRGFGLSDQTFRGFRDIDTVDAELRQARLALSNCTSGRTVVNNSFGACVFRDFATGEIFDDCADGFTLENCEAELNRRKIGSSDIDTRRFRAEILATSCARALADEPISRRSRFGDLSSINRNGSRSATRTSSTGFDVEQDRARFVQTCESRDIGGLLIGSRTGSSSRVDGMACNCGGVRVTFEVYLSFLDRDDEDGFRELCSSGVRITASNPRGRFLNNGFGDSVNGINNTGRSGVNGQVGFGSQAGNCKCQIARYNNGTLVCQIFKAGLQDYFYAPPLMNAQNGLFYCSIASFYATMRSWAGESYDYLTQVCGAPEQVASQSSSLPCWK